VTAPSDGVGVGGILALSAAVLAVWYWISGLQARERAALVAAETCRAQGLQFLDDTVALQRLSIGRTPGGRLAWHRTYRFEYSETGVSRAQGFVLMLGAAVQSVGLASTEDPGAGPQRRH